MLDVEVLLVILVALQASQALEVYQIPRVSAIQRGSVTLFCNFTTNETNVGFYKWFRHHVRGDEVTNRSAGFLGRVSLVRPEDFQDHKLANIHLHHLNESDTGLYICAVTVIAEAEVTAHGNGTFLIVTRLVAGDGRSVVGVTVGVSAMIVVIVISSFMVVFFGHHKKWSDCRVQRMMGGHEVHTYCTVEEVRSHHNDDDDRPVSQEITEMFIRENLQYAHQEAMTA